MAGSQEDGGDFRRMVEEFEIKDIEFIRHNATDFESFREFSRAQEERFEAARLAKELESKKKNLTRWLQSVPDRWRGASLRNFNGDSIGAAQSSVAAARRMLKAKQRGFYIAGPHTTGKTYLAYAIVREFIAHGKLKPSQVRVITEEDLLSMASGGYESRERFEDVFDSRFKCYIFDSLGARKEYNDRQEGPALTRLIEEAYNRSALFISTSHMVFDLYESGLPEQAAAKFRHMVKDGQIYTGQPNYGKSDERRNLELDVDLYNTEGRLSFAEIEDVPVVGQTKSPQKRRSAGASWKDSTPKIARD